MKFPVSHRPLQRMGLIAATALTLASCGGVDGPGGLASSSDAPNRSADRRSADRVQAQAVSAAAATPVTAAYTHDKMPERLRWLANNKFGMFIHFGVYSLYGGRYNGVDIGSSPEWVVEKSQIPMTEYQARKSEFNPTQFNAKEIVGLAKTAGMKYICVTAQHHDGFSLFPENVTYGDASWTLAQTPIGQGPNGRDLIQELKTELDANGMDLCLYHTVMNWSNPYYANRRAYNNTELAQSTAPDSGKFLAYMKNSVGAMMDRYHPKYIWFDGYWESGWSAEAGQSLRDFVNQKDPSVLLNDRTDPQASSTGALNTNGKGDVVTPERFVPTSPIAGHVLWETCDTVATSWGYNINDESAANQKPLKALLNDLVGAASGGGNFLLNTGPRGDGSLVPESVKRLKEMGGWMDKYSEAIHGTRQGIGRSKTPWGYTTVKELSNGNSYIYAFIPTENWPAAGQALTLAGVTNAVVGANLMGSSNTVSASNTADGRSIVIQGLPSGAVDAHISVVRIEVQGPEVNSNGAIPLSAASAQLTGSLFLETKDGSSTNIGGWTQASDTVSWSVNIPTTGWYLPEIQWSSPITPVATVALTAASQTTSLTLANSGGWTQWQTTPFAQAIQITTPGTVTVTLKASSKPGFAVANVRGVTLRRMASGAVQPTGSTVDLPVTSATLTGGLQVETKDGTNSNIGHWKDVAGTAAWAVSVPAMGRYQAEIEWASPIAPPATLNLRSGPQSAELTLTPGSSWTSWQTSRFGSAFDLASGSNPVVLGASSMPGWAVANIKSLKLVSDSTALVLPASQAAIAGSTLQLEGTGDSANLGYWTAAGDSALWHFDSSRFGASGASATYAVSLTYAAADIGQGNAAYSLAFGGQSASAVGLNATLAPTGGWGSYRTVVLGNVTLDPALHTLKLLRSAGQPSGPINVRAIRLDRIG